MSFILDALRKVDRENRPPVDEVPPVVGVERVRKERLRRRYQFAAMAAIAALSAATTALLLREPRNIQPEPQLGRKVESPVVEAEPLQNEEPAPERKPAPPPRAAKPGARPVAATPAAVSPRAEPPQEEPPRELPRLVLQGTSVLDGRPVAVVSDRRVFVGDIIDGAIVLRIEERLVELEFDGRRFTLTF
jgi:hypothetical protein